MRTSCFDCEFERLGHPCQTNGRFDAKRMGRIYVSEVLRAEEGGGGEHWLFGCIIEKCQHAPDEAWELVLAVLPLLETPEEAGLFAASHLEDLIADSGEAVIDRIEALACKSPRFRYLLTGVWPLGNRHSEVWARVWRVRQGGAHIDKDPLPPA